MNNPIVKNIHSTYDLQVTYQLITLATNYTRYMFKIMLTNIQLLCNILLTDLVVNFIEH
jgi:hypothetical protein